MTKRPAQYYEERRWRAREKSNEGEGASAEAAEGREGVLGKVKRCQALVRVYRNGEVSQSSSKPSGSCWATSNHCRTHLRFPNDEL